MHPLDDEQLEHVRRLHAEPTKAALVASTMGSGKTNTVTTFVIEHNVAQTVIVAPIGVIGSWCAALHSLDPNVTVFVCENTKSNKNNLEKLFAGVPGVYVMGREYLMQPTRIYSFQKYSPNIGLMVYDEAHTFGNRKSETFKKMKHIRPQYRVAISATPQGNNFANFYAITFWLWPEVAGNSFWRWVDVWCETKKAHFSDLEIVGEKNPGEYVNKLPCYLRMVVLFPEIKYYKYEIELSDRERQIYTGLDKKLAAWVRDNPLIIRLPATKRIRLRQQSLGEIVVDGTKVVTRKPKNSPPYEETVDNIVFPLDMRSTTLDALETIMVTYLRKGKGVLITCDSAGFVAAAVHQLVNKGYRVAEWSGRVTKSDREVIKQQFVDGEIDFIIAVVSAIAEGTDGLQHRTNIMVRVSLSDNGVINEQALGRLNRRGQKHRVVVIDMVRKDTYDEGQASKLVREAMKRNKELKRKGVK